MDFLPFIEPYWIWLGLTIVLALIELATAFALTTICFAAPAFLLIFLSALIISFRWQVAIFLVLSLFMLIVLRPIAIKKLKVGREKTNIDSLIDCRALVTKRISEFEKGEVKLNGQFWQAQTEGGLELEVGAACRILRIEGAHAVVGAP